MSLAIGTREHDPHGMRAEGARLSDCKVCTVYHNHCNDKQISTELKLKDIVICCVISLKYVKMRHAGINHATAMRNNDTAIFARLYFHNHAICHLQCTWMICIRFKGNILIISFKG